MNPSLQSGIPFWKVAGGANDYILLDGRGHALPSVLDPAWVIGLCTRRFGIGSDGLLLVQEPKSSGDYRIEFYNPDGSTHGLCGNGTRCVARVALQEGWAGDSQQIELPGGAIRADVWGERVRLQLKAPRVLRERMEVATGSQSWLAELFEIWVPHLIVQVSLEDLADLDIDLWGSALRHHPEFQPEGTNVIFTAVRGSNGLDIRSFERGVEGETLACGSGATAAATSMVRNGLVVPPVDCHTVSGTTLTIGLAEGTPGVDAAATLEGDARIIAKGVLGPDVIASTDLPA